ncbi:MAG: AsnC family protein [Candidatus Bathyarchaeota archaeon]|nr:MAG: AsnC family protein [Candidatus Bathyarchaeota archaeon]
MDLCDLEILESLGQYGPRNITAIARKLQLAEATLRRRIRRMSDQIFLRANVYHTNIGLRKTIVFARASQGYENLLFDCLNAHDYVIYSSRCYGLFDGCVAIFAIPTERCLDFERFLEHLKNRGIAAHIEHSWSTCFQTVNLRCKWYNKYTQSWEFFWEEWIEQVLSESTDLPFTLVDPAAYPLKADEIDIFLLKELEVDATVTLKDVANKLDRSVPLIKYHYDRHVIGRRLLEDFQIVYYPFDKSTSNGFYFRFMFENLENMAKFARSLLDKPFALSIGKIFGRPALFAYIYLPMSQLREFLDSLGRLIRIGFLNRYEYVLQDMVTQKRFTIPYTCFDNGSWRYDHDKFLRAVDSLTEADVALIAEKAVALSY